jgi:uncharacterized protein (TIGR03032 family)
MTSSEPLASSVDVPALSTAPAAGVADETEDNELRSVQTDGLGSLFAEQGLSLVISTYQAGKLVIARHDDGVVNTHYLDAAKPMGIATAPGQLAVGALGEIMFFSDVKENCGKLKSEKKHDACYVQRYSHLTGAIDIHEMSFSDDGQIWFINTRFSALCTLNGSNSFMPVWTPPCITRLAAEDRCHLNGLGMRDGRPRYVTALGESDTAGGWRDHKADGGVLIDLATGKIVCRGLSMPHSPRWYADQLWVCESGKGTLSRVNLETGVATPIFEFPGFTRGLDFVGSLAFVGLSEIRETATFSGIPITEKEMERNCGVWVVDIVTGESKGILRFTSGVHEIFAVQALPGIRFPEILDKHHELALESYFLPTEVLKHVESAPAA